MRFKKWLKEVAERDIYRYRRPEMLDEMKEEWRETSSRKIIEKKPKATWYPFFRKVSAAFVIVLIVGISVFCGVYFTNSQVNSGEELPIEVPNNKQYFFENEVFELSAIHIIQVNLHNLELRASLDYDKVIKYYDKLTNDDLYYIVTYRDIYGIHSYKIKIVVNKFYNSKFIWDNEPTKYSYGELTLEYVEKVVDLGDSLFDFQTTALLETDFEKIYIEYRSLSMEETNPFFEFLESSFTIK